MSSTTALAPKVHAIASTRVRSIFSPRPRIKRACVGRRRAGGDVAGRRERALRRLTGHADGRARESGTARCAASTFKASPAAVRRWPISSPRAFVRPTRSSMSIRVSSRHFTIGPRPRLPFASTRLGIAWSPHSRYAALFERVAARRSLAGTRARNARSAHRPHRSATRSQRTLYDCHDRARGSARRENDACWVTTKIPSQIFPEQDLLARVDTGQADVGFFYRTEAVARGYPFIPLPPERRAHQRHRLHPGDHERRQTSARSAGVCRLHSHRSRTRYSRARRSRLSCAGK